MAKLLELGCNYIIRPDANMAGSYRIYVKVGEAVVAAQVSLCDRQLGEGMVISCFAVTPSFLRGRGYGSRVLQDLLEWAHNSNVTNIWAVQVQQESEGFWLKHGFVKVGNRTNDFRY
jgi:N-acetylglutamate synthase-like GNAT family acetyltransferase